MAKPRSRDTKNRNPKMGSTTAHTIDWAMSVGRGTPPLSAV